MSTEQLPVRASRRAAARRQQTVMDSDDELGDGNGKQKQQDDSEDEFAPAASTSTRTTRSRQASSTAAGRRKTTTTAAEPTSPKKRPGRTRKSVAPAAAATQDDDENIDPDETIAPAKTSPRKPSSRKTGAPSSRAVSRTTRAAKEAVTTPEPEQQETEPAASVAAAETQASQQSIPTPAPSAADPDSSGLEAPGSPLADITASAVNELQGANASQSQSQSQSQQLRRPTTADSTMALGNVTMGAIKPIRAMDTVLERPMDIVLKNRTTILPGLSPQPAEDAPAKPRICITYLILTNFKSYAGRQEVGPFHASFSSVVGPNGSGKSNVIDSLLFVFGFRASKMRQGKISALIHNSAQYPDLDHCEVAVHFNDVIDLPGGGHEVVPGSELVISRKAFKNNSSDYYINGKRSNFTEVTTLLRERGIDLDHKRFLILQGEVESIAQMKPKAGNEHEDGLLEYLEDIIGTSKYKAPIEEAAAEVEALNDVCMEKSGRVQHVEKEKNSLEDKKDRALAYVRDENDLALKQSALYQLYIAECEDNVVVTEEAIAQMQAQVDAELAKLDGSVQQIRMLEKAYQKGSKEYEAQAKDAAALAKELASFDQERLKFDEKRKFLTDKRRKLEKTIKSCESAAAEAEQTMADCAAEMESGAAEIVELEKLVAAEEAELAKIRESLKGKTQVFSDQIAAKQKSLEPWKEKIGQKLSAIAVAESEMAILREKANAGAVALGEMQAKIAAIEEARAEKLEHMKKCEAEKAQLEKEARKVEAELQQLADQEPKIRSQLSAARQKADEARSSLSKTQTQGNVLAALMRMKESGRIDGFHGRLGNLGTIDAKYDVAISTACGALDNFVTDTVEAGQQCIEYLRKTNLGRANFICLDKLRVRDMSPIATPENAPRLFDLVRAKDERFRAAFYHALQDTLVAKDLAQANRIAYGERRWRVVTLDGELIDKSGTMSGGGGTVKRGLMSSKLVAETTKEQVAKLEADRDALEARFTELQEQQRGLETRLRELQAQIPKLETRMQKIGLEVDSAEKKLADAQKRADEISREHQPSKADDSRVAALERDVARLQAEVEQLRSETTSVEDEIKALQDRIMEVGGEKLRAQRARVDGLRAEVAAQNEAVSAAEVRKAKAEKQRTKLAKDQAKATKELEAATADLERLEDEVANQGTRADDLRTRVAEAEAALEVKKRELNDVKAELDERQAELNASKSTELELRNQLEENQKQLAENKKRLRYWEDKLGKLQLQDIDDLYGPEPEVAPSQPTTDGKDAEEGDDSDDTVTNADTDASSKAPATASFATAPERQRQPQTLPRFTRDELAGMSRETLKGEIAALEEKVSNAGAIDLSVLGEYRRRVAEYQARAMDLAQAVAARDAAKKRCDDLRRLRLEGFMEGFSIISLRLKEMYQMITMGGNAELELVDSLDPFSEGILFSVMPPKKSWKNISNLSGGEKTLSSLALVFALHHYKPTPLYVMDEIDAALDFRNVSTDTAFYPTSESDASSGGFGQSPE